MVEGINPNKRNIQVDKGNIQADNTMIYKLTGASHHHISRGRQNKEIRRRNVGANTLVKTEDIGYSMVTYRRIQKVCYSMVTYGRRRDGAVQYSAGRLNWGDCTPKQALTSSRLSMQ